MSRVVELVSAAQELSQLAVRIIGNIASGDDQQTQRAVDCSAALHLSIVLNSE